MTHRTAAHRYARALFDVALREQAELDGVDQELAGFVDLFQTHPDLAKVMLNPAVPVPRKRAAIAELTTLAGTAPIVTKLLAMLAERDRLVILPDLLASFRDRVQAHRKVVRAAVTTATPLPADAAASIEGRLAALTGSHVLLQVTTDPAIIGGLVARIGSTVYDGSLTHQLQRMKDRLAESL